MEGCDQALGFLSKKGSLVFFSFSIGPTKSNKEFSILSGVLTKHFADDVNLKLVRHLKSYKCCKEDAN